MKRYFITGTDTDCGKTFVTCQLLSWFNSRQQKAQALKPLASACVEQNGQLVSDDVTRLQQHNCKPQQIINYKRYAPPISPHLAAKQVNDNLSTLDLVRFCEQEQFSVFDYLLIEGAGGLMVPLNDEETWLDFLRLTEIPVILVVGMRLGCINHALLTDAVLQMNKISCLGWIANSIDNNMLVLDDNIATLSAKMHMPLIATVPYGGNITIVPQPLVGYTLYGF